MSGPRLRGHSMGRFAIMPGFVEDDAKWVVWDRDEDTIVARCETRDDARDAARKFNDAHPKVAAKHSRH